MANLAGYVKRVKKFESETDNMKLKICNSPPAASCVIQPVNDAREIHELVTNFATLLVGSFDS